MGGGGKKRCEGRRQSNGRKIQAGGGEEVRTFPVDVAHTGQGADASESGSDYNGVSHLTLTHRVSDGVMLIWAACSVGHIEQPRRPSRNSTLLVAQLIAFAHFSTTAKLFFTASLRIPNDFIITLLIHQIKSLPPPPPNNSKWLPRLLPLNPLPPRRLLLLLSILRTRR